MRLDMTVTFGNVLQIGATVVAIVVAYYAIRERLVAIEVKLSALWDWWLREKGEKA